MLALLIALFFLNIGIGIINISSGEAGKLLWVAMNFFTAGILLGPIMKILLG